MKGEDKTQPSLKLRRAKKIISKLPDAPGVYFFKRGKKILYIGKATSIRDRVRSYFSGDINTTRGPLISKMITEFTGIAYQKTDSVLEALVLEANLIKKHQPEANVKDKDNKSFNYVVITHEDFPRILIIRGRELEKDETFKSFQGFALDKIFGPFPNGSQLREAMKIVRKMFPFRGNKCEPGQGRPCFEKQIELCPGVCTGEISKEDYAKQIKNIILFFEGNKNKLIKNLQKEMKEFAKKREFEKADKVKRQIFALYHIQDVSLIKNPIRTIQGETLDGFRIESYDIAHLSGTNVVGVMTVIEEGEVKKSDYRKFSAREGSAFGGKTILGDSKVVNDPKALSEILSRRLGHPEWPLPDLIVVDGGKAQKSAMEKVLEKNSLKIPVVSVVKNERHRPREILGATSLELRSTNKSYSELEPLILLANSEAHRFALSFHKHLRGKMPS